MAGRSTDITASSSFRMVRVYNPTKYKSSVTNSYNKCIRQLTSKFEEYPGLIEKAIVKIDPHDQNSFDETVFIEDIWEFHPTTGERCVTKKRVLRIIGTYRFRMFAHCKEVEMWIEEIPV